MDKKYIFFDIDGTLTEKSTGIVVPSALEAIKQLKANGHFVAIATGRAFYKTKSLMEYCQIDHLVSNGGAAIVIDGQLIENQPLDHEKAVNLCKEAEKLGYGILVAVDDSSRVVMKNDLFIQQVGKRQEPTTYEYMINEDFNDLSTIYKIYISIPKEKEYELTLKDSLGHMRFVEQYLMYQHDKKNKGIERVLEIMNGKDEDVVVFGDDTNDLVMFQDKWFKIAMGNACDELKEKADFVTKSNVDNGIFYACRKFGWI